MTLSTLFPDLTRPQFGTFVAAQTLGLAAHPGVELQVVAPIGLPPFGRFHPHYRALAALQSVEPWRGVTVHRPRFTHWPKTGGRFDVGALARAVAPVLRAMRRDFPFDIIDAEFFFPDGPAAVTLAKMFDVPVSIKARGADIHFWGHNPATAAQLSIAGRTADGLLAVSSALKADMIALGMPADRISVHHTGIDRTHFHVRDRAAAKAALGIGGPLLVSVGALIPRKRHDLAIEAVKRVPGATLAIIGAGPERAKLEAAARGASVCFLGSQPHEVIADWLAAADAMVLMSASEGLANAWVEALACGTPIVIANVGGAREVLDKPEAGSVVKPDPSSVADAITRVLARNADRHTVAATVAPFSWEENTAQLYAHLTALVTRR